MSILCEVLNSALMCFLNLNYPVNICVCHGKVGWFFLHLLHISNSLQTRSYHGSKHYNEH